MPAASSSISRRSVGLAAITALILPWLTRAGRMGAGRGVGEQQGDVLLADVAAVDPIGRAGAALDPPGDLDLAHRRDRTSPSLSPALALDQHRHLGEVARGPQGGAGEDDVVHAGAAHRFGRASPITQRIASSTFDLPQPFGPTMPVSPSSTRSSAGSTKLLKPESLSRLYLHLIVPAPCPRLAAAQQRLDPRPGVGCRACGR